MLLLKGSLISIETPGATELLNEINQILNDYTNTMYFSKASVIKKEEKKTLEKDMNKFQERLRNTRMSVKAGKSYKGEIKSMDAKKLMEIISA